MDVDAIILLFSKQKVNDIIYLTSLTQKLNEPNNDNCSRCNDLISLS